LSNDDLFSGQRQIDAYVERFCLPVMPVRDLDGHAAPDNAVIERFQFFGFRAYPTLDLGGVLDVSERDL
jgi:hypothetical protein